MDKIEEQLNNLSEIDLPVEIHRLIIRKINYQRIKLTLFVAFALLAFSFIAIIWQINTQLINAEFTDMMQDFFNVFNFNFDFINTIWGSFFEIISPALALSAVLSLVGAIYAGKKITMYQFSRII